ncbi:TPA: hypothetical protein N0F65_003237 [Lagenidium giganteum]|uniref:Small ribosomal subunit protein mS35 mitochondrial conserved domain-containing protein n=1 Tax=Lagenidium giganteum TaxID=4803 RepID=A0AAV2ZC47_9STRA|nr:TPA: hypothetical protein N0F65_003237 [Lagenidium giganteum]
MLRQLVRTAATQCAAARQVTVPSASVRCLSVAAGAENNSGDKKKPAGNNKGNKRFDGANKGNKGFAKRGGKGNAQAESNKQRKPTMTVEATEGGASDAAPAPKQPRKKVFNFSKNKKEEAPALEEFEYPAYWTDDFPEGFDDEMKHEVEKLQIFSDFTPLLDLSWQQQIHPKFDGTNIKLTLNCPLEDFNERLFVDDKSTYDTKVIMEVPLSCFTGLDKKGIGYVMQLAGPRYNRGKRSIKLTEDKYPKRVYNHKRLCDILRDLTETADKLSKEAEVEAQA